MIAESSPALQEMIEANPAVREALEDARNYREVFATPEAAREASDQAAEMDRLDALFYSRRPEDHAELARLVAGLDRDAFASLLRTMTEVAGVAARRRRSRSEERARAGRGTSECERW